MNVKTITCDACHMTYRKKLNEGEYESKFELTILDYRQDYCKYIGSDNGYLCPKCTIKMMQFLGIKLEEDKQ